MHREWLVNHIGQKLLTSLSRLGYSKKGWTTGEIGVEWIKIFDEQTCTKADGEYCMLLVDGHNSHYTHTFLQYARKHKIVVLCYLAHTTHVYQGLDVVVFAVLKRYIGEERQAYEWRTGEKMKKENFLEIYGKAHRRAMQPETIKTAFQKTGMWPVNPDTITPDMMALSKPTAMASSLPIVPATPVRVVAGMLTELAGLLIEDDLEDDGNESGEDDWAGMEGPNPFGGGERIRADEDAGGEWEEWGGIRADESDVDHIEGTKGVASMDAPAANAEECIRMAVKKLRDSTLKHLIGSFPTHALHSTCSTLPPSSMVIPAALVIESKTEAEVLLLAALRESFNENEHYRRCILELQATNILNEAYCKALKEKLAFRLEKEKKGKGKGKLMGDGLPVMLTGDWFYERVVEFEANMRRKERDKESRKTDREERQKDMEVWNAEEQARKDSNRAKQEAFHQAKAKYMAEKKQWAVDKKAGLVDGKFPMPEPKLGKLLGQKPKPGVAVDDAGLSSSST